MKTYLKYQSPGAQFAVFMALAAGCFLLNYTITQFFFSDLGAVMMNKTAEITPGLVTRFKLAQLISATLSFIVPALLFGYFSSPKALPYVGIQPYFNYLLAGVGIVLIFSIQPFVGWLGTMNAKINFGALQEKLVEAEAIYTRVLNTFLKMDSAGDLLINLFIMALLPAVGEELFFRGALQKSLLRISNIPLVAIISSAAVFALLHGTFFKIIPIFTLGLMLGTVYHFTRNLWYPIIIHFLNNALAVLAFYLSDRNETIKKLADDNIQFLVFAVLISLVITVSLIMFMKKKSDEVFPAHVTDEENDYIA